MCVMLDEGGRATSLDVHHLRMGRGMQVESVLTGLTKLMLLDDEDELSLVDQPLP
jgi:hypothetical protein